MVDILTNAYAFLVQVISILPPPVYYLLCFSLGATPFLAFFWVIKRFSDR